MKRIAAMIVLAAVLLTPSVKAQNVTVPSHADLLFVGDSITAGWLDTGRAIWDREYLPLHAASAGVPGETTRGTQGRIDRLIADRTPRIVVLLIGTNDIGSAEPGMVAAKIGKIVGAITTARPSTRILLLAIFPRGRDASSPYRGFVQQTNAQLARLANGTSVTFLDIGSRFLSPGGTISPATMPDALHLSEAGYAIWADAMGPTLRSLTIP